jgi:hypothetical protein
MSAADLYRRAVEVGFTTSFGAARNATFRRDGFPTDKCSTFDIPGIDTPSVYCVVPGGWAVQVMITFTRSN